jgi:hypothetical protein
MENIRMTAKSIQPPVRRAATSSKNQKAKLAITACMGAEKSQPLFTTLRP